MKKDSWLYSDSFLKRAFAIWGHYFVANLIIGVAVMGVVAVLGLIFGSLLLSVTQTIRSDDASQPTVIEETTPEVQ